MRGLANEETGPGTALRLALPQDKAASVVQKIGTAERAQGASKYVLEGPSTAQTLMAPRVGGAVNVAEEASSALDGGLMAWARLIGNAADNIRPGLSDNQRLEVARIVLSTDPALVARALKDDSAAAKLMEATSRAVDMVVRAGTRGSASGMNLMIDNPSGND
jgi:hypothetical protein